MGNRFSKGRRGDFKVKLRADERDYMRGLCQELRALLEEGDRSDVAIRRLFPSASLDDEHLAEQVDDMIRDDLTTQRLDSLDVVLRTVDADRLTEQEMESWLAVCNDARLVIGVRLGVTEGSGAGDFEGPASDGYSAYRFLTAILSQMIEALSGITELSLAPSILRAQLREQGAPPDADEA